jgi:hypothetical protein
LKYEISFLRASGFQLFLYAPIRSDENRIGSGLLEKAETLRRGGAEKK